MESLGFGLQCSSYLLLLEHISQGIKSGSMMVAIYSQLAGS